jgi:hypothetical protein
MPPAPLGDQSERELVELDFVSEPGCFLYHGLRVSPALGIRVNPVVELDDGWVDQLWVLETGGGVGGWYRKTDGQLYGSSPPEAMGVELEHLRVLRDGALHILRCSLRDLGFDLHGACSGLRPCSYQP